MNLKFTYVALLILSIGFLTSLYCAHPYYVSTVEVNLLPSKQKLEVSCKMFTDDLEEGLKKSYSITPDLLRSLTDEKVTYYLEKYITANLNVSINGKLSEMDFIGHENIEESTWCYFESFCPDKVISTTISCSLLYELHEEQVGFIHVYMNETRQSKKIKNPEKIAAFTF